MLTRLYVEALLVDENLPDQVWELWDAGLITDEVAAIAWLQIYSNGRTWQLNRERKIRLVS